MKVGISKILKNYGVSLAFSVEGDFAELDNFSDVCKFLSPVKVEGTVTNIDDIFKFESEGTTTVSMPCGRCLKPTKLDVTFQVNENFSIAGKNEEETETFLGDTIDLSSVIIRSLIIGLPMKVLCDDDCKGLCPICGKDLNDEGCNCDTSKIDPRFESLRSLFKLDEEV